MLKQSSIVAPVYLNQTVGLGVMLQSSLRIPNCPALMAVLSAWRPRGDITLRFIYFAKGNGTLRPPGPVEERDKGVLRSRQHSGSGPASTFTLGALDPECSDIIGLRIFTAQQVQTLSIMSSDTCKVYDEWIDHQLQKRVKITQRCWYSSNKAR